jgi:hypothetical protein
MVLDFRMKTFNNSKNCINEYIFIEIIKYLYIL